MNEAKTIVMCNQKGGVGKTTTALSLGVNLARRGKKVLLADFDPQGNLTKGLGFRDKSKYPLSMKDAVLAEINGTPIDFQSLILHTSEEVDLIPSNIDLAGADLMLANVMSRETVFKRVLSRVKDKYDYIVIDSNPTLSLMTINALTAADSVIIPVQAEPYATDGLTDLLSTIQSARKQLNPNLKVDGILITMVDTRTKLSKHIVNEIQSAFKGQIRVYDTYIPRCVAVAEASLYGESPILHSPNSAASKAYEKLSEEVINDGKRISKPAPIFTVR